MVTANGDHCYTTLTQHDCLGAYPHRMLKHIIMCTYANKTNSTLTHLAVKMLWTHKKSTHGGIQSSFIPDSPPTTSVSEKWRQPAGTKPCGLIRCICRCNPHLTDVTYTNNVWFYWCIPLLKIIKSFKYLGYVKVNLGLFNWAQMTSGQFLFMFFFDFVSNQAIFCIHLLAHYDTTLSRQVLSTNQCNFPTSMMDSTWGAPALLWPYNTAEPF